MGRMKIRVIDLTLAIDELIEIPITINNRERDPEAGQEEESDFTALGMGLIQQLSLECNTF
jgi:hypothetical protein